MSMFKMRLDGQDQADVLAGLQKTVLDPLGMTIVPKDGSETPEPEEEREPDLADRDLSPAEVAVKKEELRQLLKDNLIGIDSIIDDVVDKVAGWLLIRDILPKPMIINLWGPTGSGKTKICEIVMNFLGGQHVRIEASQWGLDSYVVHGLKNVTSRRPIILVNDVHKVVTKGPGASDYPVFFSLLDQGMLPGYDEEEEEMIESGSFSSALILMTGNLDEIYGIGHMEIDPYFTANDASKLIKENVTFLDVKSALMRHLRTEHFTRLGTNHLIYPFLSLEDLRMISELHTRKLAKDFEARTRIRLAFDSSFFDYVMMEGSTATHGARPVLDVGRTLAATVMSEVALNLGVDSFPLPKVRKFVVSVDSSSKTMPKLVVRAKDFHREIPTLSRVGEFEVGNIDRSNENVAVAIHEAGHILTHFLFLGQLPVTSYFTARHDRNAVTIGGGSGTPFFMRDVVPYAAYHLGGLAAQHVILGEESWSLGNSNDINTATLLMTEAVSQTSEDGTPLFTRGSLRTPDKMRDDWTMMERTREAKEKEIADRMSEAWDLSRQTVNEHRAAIISLADELLDKGFVRADRMQEILDEHGVVLSGRDSYAEVFVAEKSA